MLRGGVMDNIIVVSGLGVEYIEIGDFVLVSEEYFLSLVNE